jgi:hypothetical protein
MRRLLPPIVLLALALPALADEPLVKSHAVSQPPLVKSAYAAPADTAPAEEPATAAEAADEAAANEAAPAPAPAVAPAPRPVPAAEITDTGPEVLFSGKVDHGAYGGFGMRSAVVAGESALLVGGRAAWLIDHQLALGFAGYALASDVPVRDAGSDKFVEMGYGGFYASYVVLPYSVVHLSLDGLLGAGALTYSRRYYAWDGSATVDHSGDAFFVGEVGANLVLNVARFMRVSAGPSWRFVKGAHYRAIRSDDVDGFGAQLTLDFGKF